MAGNWDTLRSMAGHNTLTVGHCIRVSCYVLESRTLFHRQRVCGASVYLYYFGFCTRAIYIIVIHISLGPAMRGQSYLIIKAICCIDVGTFGTVSSSVPATQLNCIFNSRSHGWPYIPFTPGFNCCVWTNYYVITKHATRHHSVGIGSALD